MKMSKAAWRRRRQHPLEPLRLGVSLQRPAPAERFAGVAGRRDVVGLPVGVEGEGVEALVRVLALEVEEGLARGRLQLSVQEISIESVRQVVPLLLFVGEAVPEELDAAER